MTYKEKVRLLYAVAASMNSSKELCIKTALNLMERPDKPNRRVEADGWLEKAAQYAWGFSRPEGWATVSDPMNSTNCGASGCGRQDINCADCKERLS